MVLVKWRGFLVDKLCNQDKQDDRDKKQETKIFWQHSSKLLWYSILASKQTVDACIVFEEILFLNCS